MRIVVNKKYKLIQVIGDLYRYEVYTLNYLLTAVMFYHYLPVSMKKSIVLLLCIFETSGMPISMTGFYPNSVQKYHLIAVFTHIILTPSILALLI